MKNIGMLLIVGLIIILCGGCASIVDGGTHKTVSIKTNPDGAKVTVLDKEGQPVVVQTAPTVISLKRQHSYTLDIEMPGYYPAHLKVKSGLNPWYLGNVIFGGAVDC